MRDRGRYAVGDDGELRHLYPRCGASGTGWPGTGEADQGKG